MTKGKKYWLDDPRNVTWLHRALLGLCAALALSDLFYDKHAHWRFERLIGFHGVFGFVGCVLLVLAAKRLRSLIRRDERYYD